jgi:hypothetical protein
MVVHVCAHVCVCVCVCQDNYTFAHPGIQKNLKAMKELVARIDSKCVCVCVYVYVCVCMYICMSNLTQIRCKPVYTHSLTHSLTPPHNTHTHTLTHTHTHTHTYTHTYTYTHIHTHTHAYTYTCTCTHTQWGRKVAEVYIPEYLFDEYRTHAS